MSTNKIIITSAIVVENPKQLMQMAIEVLSSTNSTFNIPNIVGIILQSTEFNESQLLPAKGKPKVSAGAFTRWIAHELSKHKNPRLSKT